jgi:hypothetical protein
MRKASNGGLHGGSEGPIAANLPSPSMRRPVDVKAHFHFLSFFVSVTLFLFSQAAPVAILPFALFYERYSLGARWVFSFQ